MIKVGDSIPAAEITVITKDGQDNVSADAFFAGKKVVMLALPGAFTPTCSATHLPGYVIDFDKYQEKGVDVVACLSVNDAFVMKAWQENQNAENIAMIADGGALLTKAMDMTLETGGFGGTRSKRYAMVVEDGKVTYLNVEPDTGLSVSDSATTLSSL